MNSFFKLKVLIAIAVYMACISVIRAEEVKMEEIEKKSEDANVLDIVDSDEEFFNSTDSELLTSVEDIVSDKQFQLEDLLIKEDFLTTEDQSNVADIKAEEIQMEDIKAEDINAEDLNDKNSTLDESELIAENRIVGGVVTTNIIKYLVSISFNTNYLGGGSLITPTQVLTTAYLINNLRLGYLYVRGGSAFYNRGGIIRAVIKTITPSGFAPSSFNMDIALLKLRSPMIGANISPIAISSDRLYVGDVVQLSGWGPLSGSSTLLSTRSRTVNVRLISRDVCQRSYLNGFNFVITGNMMCSSIVASKGACSADTGGPVVFKNKLCGLISFGVGCTAGYPDVHTLLNAGTVKQFMATALDL